MAYFMMRSCRWFCVSRGSLKQYFQKDKQISGSKRTAELLLIFPMAQSQMTIALGRESLNPTQCNGSISGLLQLFKVSFCSYGLNLMILYCKLKLRNKMKNTYVTINIILSKKSIYYEKIGISVWTFIIVIHCVGSSL